MFKILKARLQQYMIQELPDVQAGFKKGVGTRDQIANIHWIMEKAKELQKHIYFCFFCFFFSTSVLLTTLKPFDCVDHNKLWKILKEMRVSDHLTCLLRNLYVGQETKLESYIEQLTGSKLGKEYDKAVCCTLLTFVQSTSCQMQGWVNHKLESKLLGEISTTSDMQMIPL